MTEMLSNEARQARNGGADAVGGALPNGSRNAPAARVEHWYDIIEPTRRTKFGLLAIFMVVSISTVTFKVLGLTWVDAWYHTIISIYTVGFTEIGEPHQFTPFYRIFTSLVIIAGAASLAYIFASTFDGIVESRIREQLGKNRVERRLDKLENHVIVCGWGQVGQAIGEAVVQSGEMLVVVDLSVTELGSSGVLVSGDATEDDTLIRARIRRAKGLIVALDSDAANMYCIVTARALNPELYIVARANHGNAGPKLLQAGANRVVNPHQIGGQRMASLMLQPNVSDFLGETMEDQQSEMQLHESFLTEHPRWVGQTLGDIGLVDATGVTVLAVRRNDGSFVHHPRAKFLLEQDDIIITLGTPAQLYALDLWEESH